jgi:predicted nucleotidyltransferase
LRGIGATNVRVFGSVARGDARHDSDIDLLVDFDLAKGIFALWQANDDIALLLKFPVDLAPVSLLKPRVLDAALRDALSL